MKQTSLLTCLLLALPAWASAADALPAREAIRAAVAKSLPLLVAGAKGSMEQRKQCFTCHNQGVPLMALVAARGRGFEVDADHLQTQLTFIDAFLERNKQNYLEGKGTGGQADTAGYALFTLARGGWKPTPATAAVAHYLLVYQKDMDHWEATSRRPPSEQSHFTTTFLALQGLKAYGTPEQQPAIEQRRAQARDWLLRTAPADTEDRVFRLRALVLAGAPEEQIERAARDLLATQWPDGGWAQLDSGAPSDAYATGSALAALNQTGQLPAGSQAYLKGLAFLIGAQQEDGSWHVVSRSDPFQTYFESGYPHGNDQFISIAAAGWATMALCLALPEAG